MVSSILFCAKLGSRPEKRLKDKSRVFNVLEITDIALRSCWKLLFLNINVLRDEQGDRNELGSAPERLLLDKSRYNKLG